MSTSHAPPFRFFVSAPSLADGIGHWGDALQEIEAVGVEAIVVPDHFTGWWSHEPMVTLAAAATATTTLRLHTGVLGNDYRHPVLVHRMAATLDTVSEGRLTLGLGAGWLRSDYDAAGIAYDGAATRVERLGEAIAVVKGLFRAEPFDFDGQHYTIRGLLGMPQPVQRPHPPILIGGGGRRILELAGREADIVGINARLGAAADPTTVLDLSPERVAARVGWVRKAASDAGREPHSVVLGINHWLVRITESRHDRDDALARASTRLGVPASELVRYPGVLVGSIEACADTLLERREQYGISAFQLDAGASGDVRDLGALIARLAGN